MAATADSTEGIYQAALVNYLVSMARTVEGSVNRALEALLQRNERLASEVFLTEPRINEMEIVIDEHAIRLLRRGNLPEAGVRLIVASLKLNNDLERIGDLAVNICQRVISLASMGDVANPVELQPMTTAVRAMVSKSLGALIFQNVTLANEVLESDDVVDQYRDRIFESLLAGMTQDARESRRIRILSLRRGISSALPITRQTSRRIFCFGCEASKCATAAPSSRTSERTKAAMRRPQSRPMPPTTP